MIGDDDLDIFFDLDDFALEFTIKLQGVAVATIGGVFDEATETVAGDEIVIRPAVTFKSIEVAAIDRGHTITNNSTGIEYRVFKRPEPDGLGMTRIYLVK